MECECCSHNGCKCCKYVETRGMKCNISSCRCRYRGVVYCKAVGDVVLRWPRNTAFADSEAILADMENDRARYRKFRFLELKRATEKVSREEEWEEEVESMDNNEWVKAMDAMDDMDAFAKKCDISPKPIKSLTVGLSPTKNK